MNIDIVKEQLLNHIGDNAIIKCNLGRNKIAEYNVIIKKVIEPVKIRVDEFKINELNSTDLKEKEISLEEIENEIQERTNIRGRTSPYKK